MSEKLIDIGALVGGAVLSVTVTMGKLVTEFGCLRIIFMPSYPGTNESVALLADFMAVAKSNRVGCEPIAGSIAVDNEGDILSESTVMPANSNALLIELP
jgi:hypothetical protein